MMTWCGCGCRVLILHAAVEISKISIYCPALPSVRCSIVLNTMTGSSNWRLWYLAFELPGKGIILAAYMSGEDFRNVQRLKDLLHVNLKIVAPRGSNYHKKAVGPKNS